MTGKVPRDYDLEPTILEPQTVHAFIRELLDYADANDTWGVEVAEALVDLVATRLSDTFSSIDRSLAEQLVAAIENHWSDEPVAYVDALCTVLANLGDTRPFLRKRLAAARRPEVGALLAEVLAELDLAYGRGPTNQ